MKYTKEVYADGNVAHYSLAGNKIYARVAILKRIKSIGISVETSVLPQMRWCVKFNISYWFGKVFIEVGRRY